MKKNKRENLIKFRKDIGNTQEEMAEILDISVIMYKYLELGYKNPSFKTLEKFKSGFPEVNLDEIFF
ncbi:MAG: helix-turn-helix transcriptional regulator [Clostridia bacterium]